MKDTPADSRLESEFLCRYRKFNEDTLSALIDGKLYFSSPKYFNDPFDSTHYIDNSSLLNSVDRDLDHVDEYFHERYGPNCLNMNLDYRMISLAGKSRNCRSNFFDYLLQKEEELKSIIFDNVKIICLSSDYLSTLMWAHYADGHTGFLLMYSKEELKNAPLFTENDELLSQKVVIDAVNYSPFLPDSGELYYYALPKYMKTGNIVGCGCYLNRIFFSKMKEWAYEKEWRACTYSRNLKYPNRAKYLKIYPSAVFVGSKMCEKNRKKIYKIAKSHDIAIFEVFTNTNAPRFELNFCELKY